MPSYVGCFDSLDRDIYPNEMYRAIASCVSFHLRGKVTPEDIYEFIVSHIGGNEIRKIYNECLKVYGVKRHCKLKNNASINDVKKLIDSKIPMIYNDRMVITGYNESNKIKIDNNETYVDYVKGEICY